MADTRQDTICRIGTRGSDLALWQAHTIKGLLADLGVATDLTIIKTRGDRIDNVPFSKLEGKNFFTKELEDAQLDGRVDMAVHSLKDLATDMVPGLALCALVGREDPRELLLARPEAIDPARAAAGEVLPLKDGAVIGTSAARRQGQVRDLRPDLVIKDLRGNVPTRINKLREGQYDAILLARAGVHRLELDVSDLDTRPLDVRAFVPAPAQGMLGIQCRAGDAWEAELQRLDVGDAGRGVLAERRLLNQLEGGCHIPFGANIQGAGDSWHLEIYYADDAASERAPLRFSADGADPEELADRAWREITAYRKG
ncbi:hydroxymethylbilane synthase [bacterium]|nr:hydroxymethylbilane synthase [bacterium]